MKCVLEKINCRVEDFTLHRNAMLLIDGVESYDLNKKTITAFTHIDEKNLFYEHEISGAYSYMGFELSAQTVSIFIGIESKLVMHSDPEMGFILCLTNLQCYQPILQTNKPITIKATQTHRDSSVAYFDSQVTQNEKIIMSVSFMAMLASSDKIRQIQGEKNA